STGRWPIPIRTPPLCRRSRTSGSTRSSSRPSRRRSRPGSAETWCSGCTRQPISPSSTSSCRRRRHPFERERRSPARPPPARPPPRPPPPVAHQSSRVDPRTPGMFLFIASEVMLFGSFFTPYFFTRVVNHEPWPPPPFHLPVFVAFVNTAILVTSSFTMHWSLQSIKRGNRTGMKAGLTLTFLMGLTFLLTQLLEYARIGFTPHDTALRTA